jgi:hypothetical protein
MTPAELRAIGEAKYGRFWQSQMAQDLPCDARTIRRWLSGKRPIRPFVAARIRALVDERQARKLSSV